MIHITTGFYFSASLYYTIQIIYQPPQFVSAHAAPSDVYEMRQTQRLIDYAIH